MIHALDPLREFTFVSALLRLLLAMICGGLIGYGRSRQARSAGFRTYMLIALGSAMAVLITFFQYRMLHTVWKDVVQEVGEKFDGSRLASSVITGIGFLGAGIIIKAAHQQVSGLTTSTGLFATMCMGIACGAGYFELVLVSLLVVEVILNVMSPLEIAYKRRLRNITLNVEFDSVEDLQTITDTIEKEHATVFEIDVERSQRSEDQYPSAIIILKLGKENHSHSGMLSSLAELACVQSVQELIS